jgi:hypothetical protein
MRSSASLLMMGPVHSFLAVSSSRQSLLLVRLLLVRNLHAFLAVTSSRQISSRQSLSIFTPSLLSALYSVYLLYWYRGTDTDAAGGAGCRIKTWPNKQIPISPTKRTSNDAFILKNAISRHFTPFC